MAPKLYESLRSFLHTNGIQKQLKTVFECEEILVKINLVDPRPPETGCVTHPLVVRAVIDQILSLGFKGTISICETSSYYKGPYIFTKTEDFLSEFPISERPLIEAKIKSRNQIQNPYDFGFQLTLELSGIKKIVEEYKRAGAEVRILNISNEPMLTREESTALVREVDELLGEELLPISEVRNKITSKIPAAINNKTGLISLAVPKTHVSSQVLVTATIKNIGVGLLPHFKKAFTHNDIAKAILYHYSCWYIGCRGRIFGMVSGPYGMEENGPDWGIAASFPYAVAGSDLLAVDCATAVLMFGRAELVSQIEQFSIADRKIGLIPSIQELKKLEPLALRYRPPEAREYP
ncbi:DUF362 domain-containing protein [Candidatus Bathyarchaeota archaeon]|nr:DUF362 domain-containing protein [Candidatus Bathyarchaeota archaeon]